MRGKLVRPAQAVPVRWQHVFVLGNIKGALSIALALGLPASTPSRALIINTAFAVTFVSLVGQGLSLGFVLRKLGLVATDGLADAAGDHQVRLLAARAARHELEGLHRTGLVPRTVFEQLQSTYQVSIAQSERDLRTLYEQNQELGARSLIATRRRLIDAERTAVGDAMRGKLVPQDSAERMLAELDARLVEFEEALGGAAAAEQAGPKQGAA